MADELLHIADDSRNDWIDQRRGDETIRVADHEHIKRSQLRVETRKWLLAKMLPKVFGDKLDVTSGNKPLQSASASDLAKALLASMPRLALPEPDVIDAEAVLVVTPAEPSAASEGLP
jgi:hypothetical protein